jgi:hypothetical protein
MAPIVLWFLVSGRCALLLVVCIPPVGPCSNGWAHVAPKCTPAR